MEDTAEERLVWNGNSSGFISATRLKVPSKFLKGPVPWDWLEVAARLPAKCLVVGLCIWRLAGATRSETIKLSNKECEALGVSRYAKSRALKHLEAANLIKVEHHRGRFPRVTILRVEPALNGPHRLAV
jgi:hypothetical protein